MQPSKAPVGFSSRPEATTQSNESKSTGDNIVIKQVDNECIICFELMDYENNTVTFLPCTHRYHTSCLDRWVIKKISTEQQLTCPSCQSPY